MEALIAGYVVESMPAASAPFFTVAALAAGALAVYLYVPWWRVRGVSGPPAFPLVGHIPLLAKHGPDVFAALAKRYGPIYRFHMGRQPLIIVTDPELCREVGIKKFKSIPNRSVPSALASSPIHLKGLFLTRGSRWQSMRNVIISIYQPSHLAGLVPAIQPYLDRAARLLRPGEEDGVAFSDIALRLFTDTIGQVAFGVDFGLTGADRSTASAPEDAAADDFIRKHLYSTTSLKMDLSGSLSIMLGQLVPFLQRPARALLLRDRRPADPGQQRGHQRAAGRDRGGAGGARGEGAEGLLVRGAQRERGRRGDAAAAHAGLRERAHLRAPARRVDHHVVHAVEPALPGRHAPGGGGEAAPGGRRLRAQGRRANRRGAPDQVPLPGAGSEGDDEILHGVPADRAGNLRERRDWRLRHPQGHMGVAGAGRDGEGPGALPGAGGVPAGAVRPGERGVPAAAPLRVHPLRHRPPGVHRPEVLHAAAQARRRPPLPPLRVPPLAGDGAPAAVPVRHSRQLQARSQAPGRREAGIVIIGVLTYARALY